MHKEGEGSPTVVNLFGKRGSEYAEHSGQKVVRRL